jgi:mycothiol synthase
VLALDIDLPDAATREAVLALADRIEHEDGAPPLSDQARAQIQRSDLLHVVARDGDAVLGYGQRAGLGAELTGTPEAIATVLDALAAPGLLIWSHGTHSRIAPLLEARGLIATRVLHQLRRPLDDLPADRPLPPGVVVRSFVRGQDDAAWLVANAAAFAMHHEQARWTRPDLTARLAEDWFDPTGFLLAVRDGDVLGFHWTKIHPDGAGEVYVLGVTPAAQGLGLGPALLTRGLRHLASRGCQYVLLYVDDDNAGAMRLYENVGFAMYDRDVQWLQSIEPT